MTGLENGTQFPKVAIAKVGGGDITLPDELEGSYGVILAFRGSWCTQCNVQLASFQRLLPDLRNEGIGVVAFSTDNEEDAKKMVRKHDLTFSVGFGVDMKTMSELLQGYMNKERGSLESSNFLLRPDGTIDIAVYSSGSIGRLTPEDVLFVVNRRRGR